MAGRIRALDWSLTSLGPLEIWPDRLRMLVEQVLANPMLATAVCGTERILIYNDTAAQLYGVHHPAALGRSLPKTFPEGWTAVESHYARAFAGESVLVTGQSLDTRGEGKESDIFDALLIPIRESDGQVAYVHMTGAEVGCHTRIEAALRDSEERFRGLVEGFGQTTWEADANGVIASNSPAWCAFTGQKPEEWLGYGWLAAVHPDDRAATEQKWRETVVAKQPVDAEYRLWHAASMTWRWSNVRAVPITGLDGKIRKWAGMNIDITEYHEAQERQAVLVAELQHRTRNLMGVVRAMTESTLRASTDLADFGVRYRDRLDALARVQNLLSRLEGVERITFDQLIESELRAISAIDGSIGKVVLNGPSGIALRSSTLQTFALALHELATNAVKYGALAAPSGHLAVTWRLEYVQPGAVPWLHVDWHESGVVMPPTDAPPQGTGQGRQLIERALPYQLGATTTYVMGPDGVRCSIALPVSSRTAVEEADDGDEPAS